MTAFLGVIVALIIGTYVEGISLILIPFAAGGFIYIAGSDLIPELHKEVKFSRSFWQLVFIILGIAVMLGMLYFEGTTSGHEHEHDDDHEISKISDFLTT